VIFCVFKFQKKWANLRLPLNVQKQKVFQLQGGEAPLTSQLGALPLDPHYRLALYALAMPPLPNPKYATDTVPETRVFQATDGEGLVILACIVFD